MPGPGVWAACDPGGWDEGGGGGEKSPSAILPDPGGMGWMGGSVPPQFCLILKERAGQTYRPKREPSITGTARREALSSAIGEGSRTASLLAKTQLVWSLAREMRGTVGPGQQIWQRSRSVLGPARLAGGSPPMKGPGRWQPL